jgi:crotonobetainyl-CoA:carnitine CoA-transferase CaiB-like acyl-CoA transferase
MCKPANCQTTLQHHPLQGTRILSLALNLPCPAALLRCARTGAECTKLEPYLFTLPRRPTVLQIN